MSCLVFVEAGNSCAGGSCPVFFLLWRTGVWEENADEMFPWNQTGTPHLAELNKISGKRSPAEVKHLQVGDKEITAVADIADTLAESFSEISSNKHYSSKFQSYKAHAERQTLKFNSHNLETYNTPFSIDELQHALSSSNDSAVGPDDIHYQMLKHLPSEVLNTLLSILNDMVNR